MKLRFTIFLQRTAMLLLLFCLTMTSWADVTGTYESSTKTLTFTGDGELTSDIVTGITGYAEAENAVIESGITSIATDALAGCTYLTTVTLNSQAIAGAEYEYDKTKNLTAVFPYMTKLIIGSDVTSIGDNAFYYDTKLTDVDFSNATSLKTIGESAFNICFNLTSINLPSGVTTLGNYAFYYCYNVEKVTIPASVTSIGSGAFYGMYIQSYYVHNYSALNLEDYGMCIYDRNDESLQMLLADNDTKIVLYYGRDDTEITIPSTVTCIGMGAFYNHTEITNVDFSLATNLTTIGEGAFRYCKSLTSINLPSGVTTLGNDAFYGCSNLTTVTLNSPAIAGAPYEYDEDENLTAVFPFMTTLIIGPAVTSIGDNAFAYNSLTEINFSNATSLTTIGISAFDTCYNLTSIKLPSGVTTLGNWAFYGCSQVASVTIPASVKSIGKNAFYYILIYKDNVDNKSALNLDDYGMQIYDNKVGDMYLADNDTKIVLYVGDNQAEITIPSTITRIGCNAFYNHTEITNVDFSQATNLTTIGDWAFYKCNFNALDLTSFTKLTTIGEGAFEYITVENNEIKLPYSLVSVGDYAFYSYNSSKSYQYTTVSFDFSKTPNLKTIGNYAFYRCNFNNLYLSSCTNLTTIGEGAFEYITVDNYIELPYSLVSVGDYAFYGCNSSKSYQSTTVAFDYNNESQLTTIGSYAFAYMGISYFTVPKNVTSIGEGAFDYNDDLYSVTIESPTITNPSTTYTADNNLTTLFPAMGTLTIGDDVTAIGANCFAGATKLYSLVLGEKVASIDNTSFADCENLIGVTFVGDLVTKKEWTADDNIYTRYFPHLVYLTLGRYNETPTAEDEAKDPNFYVGKYAFANAKTLYGLYIIGYNIMVNTGECAFAGCSNLSSSIDNLANVGLQSFKGCTSITSVTLRGTTIGKEAFAGCTSLSYIGLSDEKQTIGESAFEGCTSLESLFIPESVESIASKAFYGCTSLAKVTTYREEPIVLAEEQQFDKIAEEATLIVLFISEDKYKAAAVWKNFYAIDTAGFEYIDADTEGNNPTVASSEYEPLLRYKRTFSEKTAGNWQCFYVPFGFNLTTDILEQFEFGEVSKVSRSGDDMVMVCKKLKEGEHLYINTPYFIRTKSAEAGTYSFDLYDTYYYPAYTTTHNYTSDAGDVTVKLTGVYETTNINGHYTLSVNGKFSYYNQDTNMKPNRWYMDVVFPEDESAKPQSIIFEDEEGQTGISELPMSEEENVESVYTIDGRKLNSTDNLPSGVYIVNGKKVIVRRK